jgi:hypothetical protein
MDMNWQEWVLENYGDRITKEVVPKIVRKSQDEVAAFFAMPSPTNLEREKYREPEFYKKVDGGTMARVFVPKEREEEFIELMKRFCCERQE